MIDGLAHRKQGGHDDVAHLHHGVGQEEPPDVAPEAPRGEASLHQVAGEQQEAGHVEGIDHLLGVGVAVAYIYKVEGDHQQDEHPLEEIDLAYPSGHR